jgi:hypothetical protein
MEVKPKKALVTSGKVSTLNIIYVQILTLMGVRGSVVL